MRNLTPEVIAELKRYVEIGCNEATVLLVRHAAALAAAAEACQAALRYDEAIIKRAIDGDIKIMETGGAVAMGDDLDALYEDLMGKARDALGLPRIIPPAAAAPPP